MADSPPTNEPLPEANDHVERNTGAGPPPVPRRTPAVFGTRRSMLQADAASCRMCGADNQPGALRCKSCGEDIASPTELPACMPGVVVRCLAATYVVIAVLGLVLFFVPWLRKTNARESLTQSGYELAAGKVSLTTADAVGPRHTVEEVNKVEAFAPAWFFPAGLSLVAVFGIGHVLLGGSYRPLIPLLGAAVAAVDIIVILVVEFPLEKRISLNDGRTLSFTLAVVLVFVALALTISHYAIAVWRQTTGR